MIASFPSCPIPEVARLGRTLKAWRQQVLAYFDTSGVSNGGTEAINLIIEKVRRLAHGFKDLIITVSGFCSPPQETAPTADDPNHAQIRRALNPVCHAASTCEGGCSW